MALLLPNPLPVCCSVSAQFGQSNYQGVTKPSKSNEPVRKYLAISLLASMLTHSQQTSLTKHGSFVHLLGNLLSQNHDGTETVRLGPAGMSVQLSALRPDTEEKPAPLRPDSSFGRTEPLPTPPKPELTIPDSWRTPGCDLWTLQVGLDRASESPEGVLSVRN